MSFKEKLAAIQNSLQQKASAQSVEEQRRIQSEQATKKSEMDSFNRFVADVKSASSNKVAPLLQDFNSFALNKKGKIFQYTEEYCTGRHWEPSVPGKSGIEYSNESDKNRRSEILQGKSPATGFKVEWEADSVVKRLVGYSTENMEMNFGIIKNSEGTFAHVTGKSHNCKIYIDVDLNQPDYKDRLEKAILEIYKDPVNCAVIVPLGRADDPSWHI